MLTLHEESVDYAFNKIKAFLEVNQTRENSEKELALNLFAEALGVSEEIMDLLYERCLNSFGEDKAPYVIVGALFGIAMGEHASEN